jgi:hypothetical protein
LLAHAVHVSSRKRHVRHFWMVKTAFLSRQWKLNVLLFLLVQHLLTMLERFVVDELSFFFSLLSPENYRLISLLLIFQLQFLLFWFLIFILDPFVKKLFFFNLVLQFQFLISLFDIILCFKNKNIVIWHWLLFFFIIFFWFIFFFNFIHNHLV